MSLLPQLFSKYLGNSHTAYPHNCWSLGHVVLDDRASDRNHPKELTEYSLIEDGVFDSTSQSIVEVSTRPTYSNLFEALVGLNIQHLFT